MSELCRFYGIIIHMYFDDHGPPHFHALYGGDEALVGIDSLAVLHGRLPPRAQGLVVEWASLRQVELRQAWDLAKRLETPGRIAPLIPPSGPSNLAAQAPVPGPSNARSWLPYLV